MLKISIIWIFRVQTFGERRAAGKCYSARKGYNATAESDREWDHYIENFRYLPGLGVRAFTYLLLPLDVCANCDVCAVNSAYSSHLGCSSHANASSQSSKSMLRHPKPSAKVTSLHSCNPPLPPTLLMMVCSGRRLSSPGGDIPFEGCFLSWEGAGRDATSEPSI